ncbi:MAG: hypothetical protein A3B37_03560 [Candidatus Sungbacteria bacterium RIFCSPLOWO2_01_FULL_59_16]|uniref:Uncharacterized protein n=1 Tax=Candidatus Sungbacteria bacterium RIFCSPLOWO2_01_FULL_59_16 TaxID=1802280 RepID=A0A1G2LBL4_9BACT|nr:MAG: hypothetical protein A3B37_03560 [Candidatus Sungbacteria bacterium RIFCSPLOWO2_01_FULL_59_16]
MPSPAVAHSPEPNTEENARARQVADACHHLDGTLAAGDAGCWRCIAFILHDANALNEQLRRELFDYRQRERQWNESALMRSNLTWFSEAKKAYGELVTMTSALKAAQKAFERIRDRIESMKTFPHAEVQAILGDCDDTLAVLGSAVGSSNVGSSK